MNVASDDLNIELYKLSAWETDEPHGSRNCPEYPLGFLLRKLPAGTNLFKYDDTWAVVSHGPDPDTFRADTPENAAAALCIELIKQNIITPNQRERE